MSGFTTAGTSAFFTLDDGGTGTELWKLDGAGSVELVKDLCPGSCSSLPHQLTAMNGLLFFLATDGVHGYELWKSDGTAAGTVMVRDIDPGQFSFGFGRLAGLGGVLYFSADDGVHGLELWKSDGTAVGTQLVADLNPGPGSSAPYIQEVSQGRFFFAADDGLHGQEPWISDGTAGGTHMIRDVYPGSASSISFPYVVDGEKTALGLSDGSFLFAADDGVNGEELWRTDGTDAGTVLVKDVNPGVAKSEPVNFVLLGGKIYFRATAVGLGTELWATDGTEAGTALFKDLEPGASSSWPERLTAVNGRIYFRAFLRQLWASDGTLAGTDFLASGAMVGVGTLGGSVMALTASPFHDNFRLWKTDGTPAGTSEIKNLGLQEFRCYRSYSDPKEVNGALVFYNCKRDTGLEIWKSDGTPAGTVLARSPARTPSFPLTSQGTDTFLLPFGGGLFFSADDGAAGAQVWRTDGTPGATQPVSGLPKGGLWPYLQLNPPLQLGDALLANGGSGLLRIEASGTVSQIGPSFGSYPPQRLGDQLFSILGTPGNGLELWKTDGTAAGTGLVKTLYTGPSSQTPAFLGQAGSLLFFMANSDDLWRTDGTEAGTILLRDLWPAAASIIQYPAVLGNELFFVAIDDSQFWGLWKSDGTVAGTVKVKALDQGPSVFGPFITGIIQAAGHIFLKINDGTHGEELWVSDGTETGTHLLKDIRPGAEPSGIEWRPPSGQSLLYFLADDGPHGRELWVSDGTEAGTRLLKDVRPGTESSATEWLSFYGQVLPYFAADDGVHGRELWVTDGTEAGTRLVKDIRPGVESSGVGCCLVAVQSRYFFTADDGGHGAEPWVTDGTETGTRLVKDVWPGPESSLPFQLSAMGRTLVFTASDGVHGAEPWVTSGTETGTFLLQDLSPGAQSSGPFLYTAAPPYAYFIADDGTSGTELWGVRKAALEPAFDDVHSTYWAWPYVEALAANGLTTGCGESLYCPARPVTRAEMAVFMLRVVHGNGYVPPDVPQTRFNDVPAGHWAVDWIEQLAVEGITSGCGASPPLFCPESATSRDQMAVFLLRALHGSDYTPPPATGTRFNDVPAGYWAAAWIEQLAAEGITSGCAANLFCPGDPVSREQMAVFLTRALNLPLP
jgi:ELWxxDGT repeat protein